MDDFCYWALQHWRHFIHLAMRSHAIGLEREMSNHLYVDRRVYRQRERERKSERERERGVEADRQSDKERERESERAVVVLEEAVCAPMDKASSNQIQSTSSRRSDVHPTFVETTQIARPRYDMVTPIEIN